MRYITVNIVRRQDCSQPSSSTAVVTLMVIHHLRGETFLEPYILDPYYGTGFMLRL